MYAHIDRLYKCSRCESKKEPEFVTRRNETFKRCITCGHESLHCTITTASTTETFIQYRAEPNKPIEY